MVVTLLIVWRESLEAALVVGVLLTFLARSGQQTRVRWVWAASVAGLLAAVVCAVIGNGRLERLDPDVQDLAQAQVLFVAAALLFWTVLWMQRWARSMRRGFEAEATLALGGVVLVVFLAVFREGVEAALFLRAAGEQTTTSPLALVAGGLAGGALAVGTAWVFFRRFALMQLRTYLEVTGVLLLLVAAGLLASAVNEMIGLGYLPPLWEANRIRTDTPNGAGLRVLTGYRSSRSLIEVLIFLSYLPVMLWAMRRSGRSRAARPSRGHG
jgi:high-affinity iron transporter